MGFLDGLLGTAAATDPASVQAGLAHILIPDEVVEQSYVLYRDLVVFTSKRLVLVDKQGLTGKKTTYRSIPYRFITNFSATTAGTLDYDAELHIYVSGGGLPVEQRFRRGEAILDVQLQLARRVLG